MTVSRFSLLVLLCLSLMLLVGQAFATSIYIAPTGNDTTGNGTIGNPYFTLTKAATVAVAGDTVYARGGTYPASRIECISCSGTAGNPITFTNYPGEKAVFDGTGATFVEWDVLLGIVNCSYVVVDGYEFKNALPTTLHVDGICICGASNVTVRNCIVHEVGEDGFIIRGNNILIENNEIYRAVLTNLNGAMGSSGWSCGIATARTGSVGDTNVTIRNNYVHDVWGEGINGLCSDGTIIEGNTVVDSYSVSYYLDNAKNAVIRNNVAYNTPTGEHRRNGNLPNGLLMATERYKGWTAVNSDNIQIYNNLFQRGSSGISFWQSNGDYHNLKIYHNTIVAPEGAGVSIDSASTTVGNELKNNIIYGTYSNGNPSYWVTSYNDWPNGVPTIGAHPNSFAANPLFVNPVQTDIPNGFKLGGGSPCINTGTAVGITTDFFGTTRDSQPDVGFYEYVGGPAPPVANFSGNPTSGPAPLTVAFTDLSSGSPTSWSWTFGDGGTSTAKSPSHVYNSASSYTVSLTATNAQGSDGETKTNYITVVQAQDYTCGSLTVNTGTLKSGDHTSVHTSDNAYLVIGSAKVQNKQTAQVSYTMNTGLGSLSLLTVTVEAKVSVGMQPLTVYAYNYSTSTWTSIATGTLTTTDSTVTPSVSNPSQYISGGTVQVRVKVGGSGSTAFDNSTDLVKITAAP